MLAGTVTPASTTRAPFRHGDADQPEAVECAVGDMPLGIGLPGSVLRSFGTIVTMMVLMG
jgi:hypothetical protein